MQVRRYFEEIQVLMQLKEYFLLSIFSKGNLSFHDRKYKILQGREDTSVLSLRNGFAFLTSLS